MPNHWTYDSVEPYHDLAQGDILDRTDELVELLSQYHSYFCDEKYLGFLVVTQTCDLVLRHPQNACSARHISLAAIRSFESILTSLLDQMCATRFRGVFDESCRSKIDMLLDRILNQNESALGLFYLHPDADSGVSSHSIVTLRVTIALQSAHYELLRRARRGRLEHSFASKVGWLSGNLYSRVDTPDWTETEERQSEISRIKRQLLRDSEWVSPGCVKEAERLGVQIPTEPKAAAKALRKCAPMSPRDVVIERVRAIASEVLDASDRAAIDLLAKRLRNDDAFKESTRG